MAQVGAKKAIPSKSEPKCKFCRSEHREHIDQLLLARSMREKDPATGQPINLQYVLDALTGLGIENPTEENCKTHFRRHVEVIDAGAAEEMDAAVTELYAELIAEAPAHLTATNVAEWQVKLWMARELARLRSGEGPSISTDQAQQAQRLLIQAKSDESTRQLLGGLAGAIGGALQKTLPTEARKSLPSSEPVEDAEFEVVPARTGLVGCEYRPGAGVYVFADSFGAAVGDSVQVEGGDELKVVSVNPADPGVPLRRVTRVFRG